MTSVERSTLKFMTLLSSHCMHCVGVVYYDLPSVDEKDWRKKRSKKMFL